MNRSAPLHAGRLCIPLWVRGVASVLGALLGLACSDSGLMAPPVPDALTLVAVVPNVVTAGRPSELTVTGTGFQPGAQLRINGIAATHIWRDSSTQLSAQLPAMPGMFGSVPVTVSNPNGQTVAGQDLLSLAASQLSWDSQTSLRSMNLPRAPGLADFNLDGRPDLITTEGLDGVSLLRGDGQGGFGAPLWVYGSTSGSSLYMGRRPLIADFNLDRRPDLLIPTESSALIFLGDGAGSLLRSSPTPLTTRVIAAAVGDINRDQQPDAIVAANTGSGMATISVLLGDGLGGLIAGPPIALATGIKTVAITDLNQDGNPDLVTLHYLNATTPYSVSTLLGNGNGTFAAAINIPIGKTPVAEAGPGALAIADFDGDRFPDLVVLPIATTAGGTVSLLLGSGDGRFRAPTSLATGSGTSDLATDDVNRDGYPDLLAVNQSGSLAVLLGNGAGGFLSASFYGTGGKSAALATGDINGDQWPDVVITNCVSRTTAILLNDGRGGYQPPGSYSVGQQPVDLVATNLNQDGIPDAVVANAASNSLSVLIGDGSGGFAPARHIPVGLQPSAVAASDVNGDGVVDVLVAQLGDNAVSLLLGGGDGQLADAMVVASVRQPKALALADWNNDHRLDLAIGSDGDGSVSIWLGDGQGRFGLAGSTPVKQPLQLIAADVNNDGKLDLVVRNSMGAGVVLGDGAGQLSAYSGVNGAAPASVAVGDLNRDGAQDLLTGSEAGLSLWLGNGSGFWRNTPDMIWPLPVTALALADLNRDRSADVVLLGNLGTVQVLLSQNAGSFTVKDPILVGAAPIAVVAQDINGDRLPELLILNSGSHDLRLLRNQSY